MQTVELEFITDNLIRVTAHGHIQHDEVKAGFAAVLSQIEETQLPTHVLIVVLPETRIPLNTVMMEALPLYGHPLMKTWLIVGEYNVSRVIASTLARITHRDTVHWFASESEAMAFLAQAHAG